MSVTMKMPIIEVGTNDEREIVLNVEQYYCTIIINSSILCAEVNGLIRRPERDTEEAETLN